MDIDSDEAVGRRIIALRAKLGLQQQEFAGKIGVAKNTLTGYEKGTRPVTMESARRIRRRFGVTVDWLMFGAMQVPAGELMMDLGPEPAIPEKPHARLAKDRTLGRAAKRSGTRRAATK